tara:strand:- start:1481 stop:2203 length:723 start_codon:yes stop_codon:yes gene_type:complete
MRNYNRKKNELRPIKIEKSLSDNSDGACLVSYGKTTINCTANFSEISPKWLKKSGHGWLTAEYSMLPGSTGSRSGRESKNGKQSGRTQEIQRLIGRSLRTITELKKIPPGQFIIDCDVLNADGGTRTASITGSFVALSLAAKKLVSNGSMVDVPIIDNIAAISCGIVKGEMLLDLDYSEDSAAEVDANLVFTMNSGIAEIQVSGEGHTFQLEHLNEMTTLCQTEIRKIFSYQNEFIKNNG